MMGADEEHDDESQSERLPLVAAGDDDDDDDDDDEFARRFNRRGGAGTRIAGGRNGTASPPPPPAAADAAADEDKSVPRYGGPFVDPTRSWVAATEHRRRTAQQHAFETEPTGATPDDDVTTAAPNHTMRRVSPLASAIRNQLSRGRIRGTFLFFVGGALLLCGLFVLLVQVPSDGGGGNNVSDAPPSPSPSPFVPFDYDPVPLLYVTPEGQPRVSDDDGTGVLAYTISEIRRRFDAAKEALMATLDVQYGAAYVRHVFRDNNLTALRSASPTTASSSPSGLSGWDRMKRKLRIKLLAVQLRTARMGSEGATLDRATKATLPMEPFVWATGGHSAAAGHGNLFNESYTAVLERTVQRAFGAAGVHFRARNYAMGGTTSGPEVAVCQSEIFGTDVDALSWDFGMTDGRTPSLLELYCGRAGLHPARPACVGIEVHGGGGNDRIDVLEHLDASGMTVLYLDEAAKSAAFRAVPDSDGVPEESLDDLPRFIRHFKCDGAIERGHPFCEADKWTNLTGYCPDKPKFRTGWHPGWKWHALIGRLIGMSMLQMMEEALSLLEGLGPSEYQATYDSLVAQEAADYEKFTQSRLSKQWTDVLDPRNQDDDLTLLALFRDRSICHSAFLPAESRYRGIMVMNASSGGRTDYYKGISREQADASPTVDDGSRTPRLVFDSSDRQECDVLEIDHKDYYYVTAAEGWKEWILPNQAELSVYAPNGTALKGLVAFALKPCSWGKRCNPGDVREDGLELGQIEVQVNGIAVTQWTKVMGIRFLKHAGGHIFPHNGTGQFTIRARLTLQGSYFRPTSFMFL